MRCNITNIRDQCSHRFPPVNPLSYTVISHNDIPTPNPGPSSPFALVQLLAPISAVSPTTPSTHLIPPPRTQTHARQWHGRNILDAIPDNRRSLRRRANVSC